MIDDDRYRPRQVDTKQRTLFPIDLDQLRRRTTVSVDEMRRWRERGWLVGIDLAPDGPFEPTHETEVQFVAALARSGLEDEQIEEVLSSLDRPYSYDPERTLYSFVHRRWFGIPDDPDARDIIRDGIEEYLSDVAEDGDRDELERIWDEAARHLDEPATRTEDES